jgi:hypothetical protein
MEPQDSVNASVHVGYSPTPTPINAHAYENLRFASVNIGHLVSVLGPMEPSKYAQAAQAFGDLAAAAKVASAWYEERIPKEEG